MRKIASVHAAYFSPAGTTKKVVLAIGGGVAEALKTDLRPFDFTLPKAREWRLAFDPEDLLVVGLPTYAGRLPNKVAPYVKDFLLTEDPAAGAGERPFVLPVVTYGGRAFENSLAELAGLLLDNGFALFGGAAVCCEHAMAHRVARGLPSEEDLARAATFGREAGNRLQDRLATDMKEDDLSARVREKVPGDFHPADYYTPVDLDGSPTEFLKATPFLRPERCTGCGLCETCCPMNSIHMDAPSGGVGIGPRPCVAGVCIKCHSCVRRCPEKAWEFTDEALRRHIAMLENTCTKASQENFYFL